MGGRRSVREGRWKRIVEGRVRVVNGESKRMEA